jgi:hypothetical protein
MDLSSMDIAPHKNCYSLFCIATAAVYTQEQRMGQQGSSIVDDENVRTLPPKVRHAEKF